MKTFRFSKAAAFLTFVLCLLFAFGMRAEAKTGKDYEYTVNSDGKSITLDSYVGDAVGTHSIPSEIDGYKVTAIDGFVYTMFGLSFNGATIDTIKIPSTIKEIGTGAFASLSMLKKIEVDSKNKYYTAEDGVLFNKSMDTLICCPAAKKGEYDIPDKVKMIETMAFYNCSKLTYVMIPGSVKEIQDSAFHHCESLTSVDIPDGVQVVEKKAFAECEKLTSVRISGSVKEIGARAFQYCGHLNAVTLSEGIAEIQENAFLQCNQLKEITIPESVKTIEEQAFGYYEDEESYSGDMFKVSGFTVYGKKGSAAETYAKENGFAFKEGKGKQAEAASRFIYKKNKYKVTAAAKVEYLGPSSKTVKSVSIPATVKYDGKTYTVTAIAQNALKDHAKLKSAVIGKNISKIGKGAFQNCKKLKKITIKTAKLKKSSVGSKAFKGIYKKAVFKLPKAKKKAYKKILLKKGATKKMKFK